MNNDTQSIFEQYQLIVENAVADPLAGPTNVGREVGALSPMQQQTARAIQGAETARVTATPVDPTTQVQKFQASVAQLQQQPNDVNKANQIIQLKNEIQTPMETAIANAAAELNHDPNDMQNPYVGSAEIKKEYSTIYLNLTKMSRDVKAAIQNTNPEVANQLTQMFGENWDRLDRGLSLVFEFATDDTRVVL